MEETTHDSSSSSSSSSRKSEEKCPPAGGIKMKIVGFKTGHFYHKLLQQSNRNPVGLVVGIGSQGQL